MNPLRWFNLGSGLLPPAFRPSIQPSCRLGGVVLVAGYIGEGRHVAQIGASSVALTAIRIRYLYPARGANLLIAAKAARGGQMRNYRSVRGEIRYFAASPNVSSGDLLLGRFWDQDGRKPPLRGVNAVRLSHRTKGGGMTDPASAWFQSGAPCEAESNGLQTAAEDRLERLRPQKRSEAPTCRSRGLPGRMPRIRSTIYVLLATFLTVPNRVS